MLLRDVKGQSHHVCQEGGNALRSEVEVRIRQSSELWAAVKIILLGGDTIQ